jgi:His-Xaa-Ser system radical SAM maturase HxsC
MPLSQAVLLRINPAERHGQAMAVWGTGAMVGPIAGPALGGWLTDNYNWRWVFYINLPVGIIAFLGILFFIQQTCHARRERFDFFGFGALTIAIGALQMVLDRGELKDWFHSTEIWVEVTVAGLALYLFVVYTITTSEPPFLNRGLGARFAHLGDGDIIGLNPDSLRLRVLYWRASKHNSFLVTERCNHYCLMCSQPPRDVEDGWILDEIADCIELLDPATETIGFTGGEPLLEWPRLIGLLTALRDRLPETAVHVLTNGRAFAAAEVASAWAAIGHKRLSAGIPLYSAVDHVHDYVVQARGAFDDTVLGILRLKDKGQRVEVRVVIHGVTAPRLRETCAWLARNLPFVDHIALMGLENTGFALANQTLLWIDPLDYQAALACGVDILRSAGANVSIYNLPLCLLDRSVWDVAVQSISDWKNAYLPDCQGCAARPHCAGFFSTGQPRMSRGIRPIASLEGFPTSLCGVL